jgi:hypothetical protein
MGWSTSTTIYMVREVYGHVGSKAKKDAMQIFAAHTTQERADYAEEMRKAAENPAEGSQKWSQSGSERSGRIQ